MLVGSRLLSNFVSFSAVLEAVRCATAHLFASQIVGHRSLMWKPSEAETREMDTPLEAQFADAPELAQFDVQSLNDLVVRKWYEDKTNQAKKMPDNFRALAKEGLISNSDLEDLFEAFNHIDEDGSGEIDASELSQKLSELGQGFSLLELRKLINSVDDQVGGDDKISFVEFCRAYRKKTHDAQKDRSFEDTIRKLFASYDRDKSGSLELYEVMRLLYKLPLFGIQRDIPKLEVLAQQFISDCEGAEKDGKIQFEEFYAQFTKVSEGDGGKPIRILSIWLRFASGWDVVTKVPKDLRDTDKSARTFVSFIRHAESEANAKATKGESVKGIFDPNITELGRTQTQTRKQQLATDGWVFDLIVVSPMRRTLQTHAAVLEDYIKKGVPVIAHPIIREQFTQADDIGRDPQVIKAEWPQVDWSLFPDEPKVWWYTGLSLEEAALETIENQQKKNLETDGWKEPWSVTMERAGKFEAWLRTRSERNICVVSHGGFIEALVGESMANVGHCALDLN